MGRGLKKKKNVGLKTVCSKPTYEFRALNENEENVNATKRLFGN